jgi:catechol 2,3-dioxygenase
MTRSSHPTAAAHRLPAGLRLGAVHLQVADLDRSTGYYERVLGLRTASRMAGRATLAAHGDDAPLVELHERPGAAPVPRRGRLGLYHFAILLPDRAALGRFVRHLGESAIPAGMSDHLVSEAVYLTDPDGLGIEVYADRPRAEWRYDGDEIAMTTIPLDREGVLRAAGDGRWSGMPAGTVMGHVHLFVGDLQQAGAFYHAALGFDRTVWSYPGALFMSAGGYHHHLGTNTWAAGAPLAAEGDARLLEWQIVLPSPADVTAALEGVEQAGFTVERQGDSGLLRDPWGTGLRVRV